MCKVLSSALKPWVGDDKFISSKDPSWKWVAVKKHKLESYINPGDPEILQRRISKDVVLVYNENTGNFYKPDTISSVSAKCLGVALMNPIYTVARIMYHAVKIIVDFVRLIFVKIADFSKDLETEGFCGALTKNLKDFFIEVIFKTAGNVWEIVRAPIYGVGVQIAAFEGIFDDPYKARDHIAKIESTWNHEKDRHEDIRHGLKEGDAFFGAYCFQPVGNIKEKIHPDASDADRNRKFEIIGMQYDSIGEFRNAYPLTRGIDNCPCMPAVTCC